jgi:uncharacterized protein (TIGR03437 family)
VNFLIPSTVATGPVTVTVTSGDGTMSSARATLTPLAPALYTLNASNLGAAYVDCVVGNTQTIENPFQVSGGVLVAQPVNLSACDQNILLLYGTGLDKAQAANVQVMLGNTAGTVLYAGPQGTWPGLDQINVLIPKSIEGAGNVSVVLSVAGMTANTVNCTIQ